ncbi:nickel-dependent lactate racemase [bacterium]|nr:nickel-dependent lactate racemase [bacterium]
MKYHFPYSYLPPLEIPDRNLIGIFEAGQVQPAEPPDMIVRKALEKPIAAPRLSEAVGSGDNVLILCDDNTRYTPAHLVLPHIIDELHRGGVTDSHIRILVASGTHRKMTGEELIVKLGETVCKTYRIEQHYHDRDEELVPLGLNIGGVEFLINRRLREADFIIGVGNIVPHCIKGFSGGSTIILPGVSGSDAIGAMHWLNLDSFGEEILGIRDNKVRRLIDEVALKAGLSYIVNTIVNNNMEIVHAVAGNPVEAHRTGAETASGIFTVIIPSRADIVIFDAFKNDLDFWQSTKGLIPAYICMKQGAVVIDVAECPEGICHNIPEVEQYGFKDLDAIMNLHNRKILHPVVTHNLISVYRVVTERGMCMMVSRGITRKSAEHTGLLYAETPAEALEKAFGMKGPDASVLVLRHAGNIRPLIRNTTA